MTATETPRIRLERLSSQVIVRAGQRVIADTRRALQLDERSYPPRIYVPREDVADNVLVESGKRTHCPFKGDTIYYHVESDGQRLTDAAWCYPSPIESMGDIAGLLAFDHPQIAHQLQK